MKFALITEGASEHRVIKHVISKYFKELDPVINQVQPKIVNNKQETAGGWNEVLKYCGRSEIRDILVENNYLVIQIDTDQSETAPFSIAHQKGNGTSKTNEELHSEVVTKLSSLVNSEFREAVIGKILFAVCLHSTECWLLPMYYTNNKKSSITKCIEHLNTELARLNQDTIPKEKNSTNAIRAYEAILKNWKRKSDIEAACKHNLGFMRFVESLKAINIDE